MFGLTIFESILNILLYFALLLHDALILGANNFTGRVPSELFAIQNISSGTEFWEKGIRVSKWMVMIIVVELFLIFVSH